MILEPFYESDKDGECQEKEDENILKFNIKLKSILKYDEEEINKKDKKIKELFLSEINKLLNEIIDENNKKYDKIINNIKNNHDEQIKNLQETIKYLYYFNSILS